MSRYVFILGAGASKDCGAPLMADFLETAAGIWRRSQGAYAPPFDLVARAVSALQIVHFKAELDVYNLEPVFGAFEMGRLLGRLPGFNGEAEINALLVALREVIAETLTRRIIFPIEKGIPYSPPTYFGFGKLVAAINEQEQGSVCSVITFNYDILSEFGLLAGNIGYDYRLPVESEKERGQVPLLKLYGSLSWGYCGECRQIIPAHITDYIYNFQYGPTRFQSGAASIDISALLRKSVHCGKP